MATTAGEPQDKRLYAKPRAFFVSFLLPFVAVVGAMAGLAYLAAGSFEAELRRSTVGAAEESLFERKRIFFEAVQSAKRAAYEIAQNADALSMIEAWNAADSAHPVADSAEFRRLGDTVEAYSGRLIREIAYYESVFYLDPNGVPVYSRGARDLFDAVFPGQSDYFESAARGNVALTGPYGIGEPERMVVVSSSPTYDAANRYVGSGGIVIGVERFLDPVTAPREPARFQYGVIDENGFVLTEKSAGGGRFYFPSHGRAAQDVVATMDAKVAGSGFITLESGDDMLIVWEPLIIKPWTLYALLPARQVRDPVRIANLTALAAILAVAVGTGNALVSSRRLRIKNEDLEEAIRELGDAQDRLIETERSAVLGSAVAGLAHELNTPIGVALTSASFMRDIADRPFGLEDDPAMAVGMLKEMRMASGILTNSLKRASAIVDSFKRVSAGGGDETPVIMELGQAVEDAVNVLSRPLLDANAHPVFSRDAHVFVRASYAALNRSVASVVAAVASWSDASVPKLLQVLVSGVNEKALVEFALRPLPADPHEMVHGTRPPIRPAHRTTEAGIVRTLVEKDLNGEVVIRSEDDGGFTITIRLDKAVCA